MHETDRLFSCLYCRVRLYLPSQTPFQCYIPPKTIPKDGLPLYMPYWRFRGVSYLRKGFQVLHRVVDTSVAGYPLKGLPYSLGLRPQAMRLRFLASDTPGRFIMPSLDLQAFLGRIGHGLSATPLRAELPLHGHAFIGETVTLIHTPFFFNGDGLWDALMDRFLPVDGVSLESLSSLQEVPRDTLRFLAALCPECGRDLEAHKDSAVLLCTSCQCAWEPGTGGFERVQTGVVESEEEAHLWLPFWRMEVEFEGLSLNSVADFIRFTGLPRIPLYSVETAPFAFWVPAFKLHPHLFLRVSRQMTVAQLAEREEDWPASGEIHPCCLPPGEALECLPILLADLSPAREAVFPRMKHAAPVGRKRRVVLVPFLRKPLEIIQPRLGFSIPVSALRFGRSL